MTNHERQNNQPNLIPVGDDIEIDGIKSQQAKPTQEEIDEPMTKEDREMWQRIVDRWYGGHISLSFVEMLGRTRREREEREKNGKSGT